MPIQASLLYLISLSLVAFLLDSLQREKRISDAEEIQSMTFYSMLSCTGLLVCFLFIPPGSLPALVGGNYTAYGALFPLFFCAILMNGGKSEAENVLASGVAFSFALLLAFHAMVILMLKRGIPGDAFSLEMFSSIMPWAVMGARGRTGLLFLFISLMGMIPLSSKSAKGWGIAVQLRRMCALALMIRLFLPFSIGRFLPVQPLLLVLIDFKLFWLEALLFAFFAAWYQKKRMFFLTPNRWLQVHVFYLLLGVLLIASELTYKSL